MTVLELNTPQANRLQSSIQKKLAEYAYSEEEDTVMSEYIIMMLSNQKDRATITAELAELIGADSFDASFTDWLFDEMERVQKDASRSGVGEKRPREEDEGDRVASEGGSGLGGASETAGDDGPKAIQTIQDSREAGGFRGGYEGRGRGRDASYGSGSRQQRGLFNNAVSNASRQFSNPSGRRDDDGPPARRQRLDDGSSVVPTGPRLMNGDERKNAGRSIFDRVGPAPGNNNFNSNRKDFSNRKNEFPNGGNGNGMGGGGGMQGNMVSPLPPMGMGVPISAFQQAPDGTFFLPPGAMPGYIPPPGMVGGMMMPPQQFQYHPQNPQMMAPPQFPYQQQPYQRGPQHQKPTPPLPSKPTETQLCTFNTECKKPSCPYSHASPVASKESGLVLSEEACAKQLDCLDKDCSLSHVSPAQKSAKSTTDVSSQPSTSAPPPQMASAPASIAPPQPGFYIDPNSIPGAGTRPCKFGPACTRPGCVFVHPWDVAPCRYGFSCTRSDCKFSHPPGKKFQNKTLIVNGAGKEGIGKVPDDSKELMSERLKRFANDVPEEEKERIIPKDSAPKSNEVEKEGGTLPSSA